MSSKKKSKINKSKKQPDEFSSSSDEEFSESSEQQFSSDEMDEQSNSQTTNDRELSSAGVSSEPTTISTSSTTGLLDVAQMLKDVRVLSVERMIVLCVIVCVYVNEFIVSKCVLHVCVSFCFRVITNVCFIFTHFKSHNTPQTHLFLLRFVFLLSKSTLNDMIAPFFVVYSNF